MIKKFRKKPIIIEALQYDGKNIEEVQVFIGEHVLEEDFLPSDTVVICTLEGNMNVSINDWVIKGVKGEFYPCKPDIFEATYELVN